MLKKGCRGYLVSIENIEHDELRLQDIPIVNKFLDVFIDDLSGLPPNREIEFTIELAPTAGLISKAPYQMPPMGVEGVKRSVTRFVG